ncbi:MAG: AzlC family ABC transporter permease [Betaproteobacteria bacterium]|nr:AzlC family ABC transporter permease [Betaproteobacteria bacterium]
MIGYLPVAIAFGVAGISAGFAPWQIILMSSLIFAGSNQFILLAAFNAGTPWMWVVGLCGLMSIRHLLYGPLIASMLPLSLRTRLAFAFTLTDEVFATALSRLKTVKQDQRGVWLAGLGLGSYFAWVTGTSIGAYTGGQLEKISPFFSHAMLFSLPALFLALAYQCFSMHMKWPLTVSAVCAAILANSHQPSLAIIVGAFAGSACYWRKT